METTGSSTDTECLLYEWDTGKSGPLGRSGSFGASGTFFLSFRRSLRWDVCTCGAEPQVVHYRRGGTWCKVCRRYVGLGVAGRERGIRG